MHSMRDCTPDSVGGRGIRGETGWTPTRHGVASSPRFDPFRMPFRRRGRFLFLLMLLGLRLRRDEIEIEGSLLLY